MPGPTLGIAPDGCDTFDHFEGIRTISASSLHQCCTACGATPIGWLWALDASPPATRTSAAAAIATKYNNTKVSELFPGLSRACFNRVAWGQL